MERLLQDTCHSVNIQNPISFSSISYEDALVHYGSDKPDLRIPMTIHSLPLSICQSDAFTKVEMMHFPGMAKALSNSKLKQILKTMENGTDKSTIILRVKTIIHNDP